MLKNPQRLNVTVPFSAPDVMPMDGEVPALRQVKSDAGHSVKTAINQRGAPSPPYLSIFLIFANQ